MIQLILDTGGFALALPESYDGGYDVHEEPNYKDVKMISGRLTREYKNKSWVVSHQYGYLTEEQRNRFLAACKKGLREPILCSFLTRESPDLITAKFLVTDYRPPKFMWSQEGKPLWGDYYVQLREVNPHA